MELTEQNGYAALSAEIRQGIIEEIRIYDRAEFNSKRRFYRYMNDVAEYHSIFICY